MTLLEYDEVVPWSRSMMIQILEGMAAGAILEDARICGVGEQQWINLADVAYTRDDGPEAGLTEEADPAMGVTGALRPFPSMALGVDSLRAVQVVVSASRIG